MEWWLCSDMTDFPLGKGGCQAQIEEIPKALGSKRKVGVRRGTLGGGEPWSTTAESSLEGMPFHLVKM